MKTKVYERIYDEPLNEDGTKKPNKLLGTFDIEDGLPLDYGYTCYGVKGQKLYKIFGQEISYKNGGTKHHISEITESPDVKAYIKFNLTK